MLDGFVNLINFVNIFRSDVFITNFEHISHLVLVFLFLSLSR